MFQGRASDGRDEIMRTVGRVAVDTLFVFQKQPDAFGFGDFGQGLHAADDFVAVGGRVVAFRHIEAENADAWRGVEICQTQSDLIAFQVRLEGVGDFDFADGRADGAQAEAVLPEQVTEVRVFVVGEVEDILAVDRTEFDVFDAMVRENFDLFLGLGEISSAKVLIE